MTCAARRGTGWRVMRLCALFRTVAACTVADTAAIAAGSATRDAAAASAVLLLLPPALLPLSQQPLKLMRSCPSAVPHAARAAPPAVLLVVGIHNRHRCRRQRTAGGTPRAHIARAH